MKALKIRLLMSDSELSSNGWTQYQKLVLTELTRHEDKQEELQKSLLELQLAFARLETKLAQNHASITTLFADNKALDKARETHNIDLKAIQWKVTAFATGIAAGIAILTEILIKMFVKG